MSYRQERREKRARQEMALAGVMPAARQLGEALGEVRPIPELEPIQTQTFRLTNWRAWGFPSKAAMDEAFYGDDHD